MRLWSLCCSALFAAELFAACGRPATVRLPAVAVAAAPRPDTSQPDDAGWLVFPPDSLSGHFTARDRVDTLRLCVVGGERHEVIDSVRAEPEWIDNQLLLGKLEASAALYGARTDTLWLQYFVYCLLNISDVDGDGLDELAVSDDVVDMSFLNSCQIYSRKTGRWTCILSFNAHENSFLPGEPGDSLSQLGHRVKIPPFLKRERGHWYFQDCLADDARMDANGNLPWHRIGPHFKRHPTYGE